MANDAFSTIKKESISLANLGNLFSKRSFDSKKIFLLQPQDPDEKNLIKNLI